MNETVLIGLMALATMSTGATLATGASRAVVGVGEEAFAALGVLLWGAVSLGATNVEKITQCCRVTYSEPLLTYAAGALVVGHIVLLFFGVVSLLDVRDATSEPPGR